MFMRHISDSTPFPWSWSIAKIVCGSVIAYPCHDLGYNISKDVIVFAMHVSVPYHQLNSSSPSDANVYVNCATIGPYTSLVSVRW